MTGVGLFIEVVAVTKVTVLTNDYWYWAFYSASYITKYTYKNAEQSEPYKTSMDCAVGMLLIKVLTLDNIISFELTQLSTVYGGSIDKTPSAMHRFSPSLLTGILFTPNHWHRLSRFAFISRFVSSAVYKHMLTSNANRQTKCMVQWTPH